MQFLFSVEEWVRGAERRSSRHAAQTQRRAQRNRLDRERGRLLQQRERLLELGADPAWASRVIGERGDRAGEPTT